MKVFFVLSVIVIAGLYWWYLTSRAGRPLEPSRQFARVEYVIDGDTLILRGRQQRLRLWGVDAPEKGEAGAKTATAALKRYAPKGRKVSYIQMDVDRYGRIVARVFYGSKEINRQMIESGAASEYCRYSRGFYGHC